MCACMHKCHGMHMGGSERTCENCFSPFTMRAPDSPGSWAWCLALFPTEPSLEFLIILVSYTQINKLVSNDMITHFST